jgi:hypothetical protein
VSQDLGTAVLRLEVKTQEALQALEAFRGQVATALKDTNASSIFNGVEQSAKSAGERAGKALTEGVKKAAKELNFSSFQQALDFTPKNTIRGLEEYSRALRNLRDKTDLSVAGTQQLTDRLGAVDAALRQAKQTTAQTTAEQKRFNDTLDKVALQRFSDQAKSFAAALREQAKAAGQNAEQFRRMREQAEGAAKAVAGIAAKGAVEAIKVPIFGLPNNVTSTFDKAKAQIERLQRQAETASGKVARLSEGLAVLGAGGVAAKGVIDTLGGIGAAANNTTGILNKVQAALESLPGPLRGLGGLDDIFASGAQAVQQWSTSLLQAQGDLSTLAAPLEAVSNSLASLGPEAAAVGGALAFTFAGFQDLIARSFKPGIDGARAALKGMTADTQAMLEALAAASEATKGIASLGDLRIAERDATNRVQGNAVGSEENVQASKELLEIQRRIKEELQAQFYQNQKLALTDQERAKIAKSLRDAATTQRALPSSQLLSERLRQDNQAIKRLDQAGPAVDVGLQSARNFTAELNRAGQAGEKLPPIFGQVGKSLGALVDLTTEQTLGLRVQNELLEDQIAKQNQLRAIEADRAKQARARLAQEAQRRQDRDRAIGEFGAVPIDGRLPGRDRFGQPQFAPGSPGARAARNRRLTEAGSNALIGGAFPALFGQGLGASLGGLIGGGAGGLVGGQFGFGLSLVGTALGSQFDLATQKLQSLGDSLSNPVRQFSALAEAGVLSSKGLERQIEALISTGREAEAAALIQQDLAKTYGDLSVARELTAASDDLNRAWSKLQISAVGLAAVPLADLLNSAAEGVSTFALTLANLKKAIPEPVRNAGSNLLRTVIGGTIGNGFNVVQGAARIFNNAVGGGSASAEEQKAAKALSEARELRNRSVQLSYRQLAADAQNNKVLSLGLELQKSRVEEQRQLSALSEEDAAGPRGGAIREAAAQNRQRLAEAAAEAARSTSRDLESTQKLVGLYGESRRIREEELRIAEAKRVADQAAAAYSERASGLSLEDETALANQRDAAANEYNRVLLEGQRRIKDIENQRWADNIAAANELRSIQDDIAIEQRRSSLSGSGIGALQAAKTFADSQRAEQTAQAALRVKPGDQNLINAAQAASEQVKLAAAKTKADLQDAFKTAQDAVRNISKGIQDSVLSLQQLQNTSGNGLNRFLPPELVARRQQSIEAQILPLAGQIARQLGVNLTFNGTTEQRNAQVLDLIDSFRKEQRLSQDIATARTDLFKAQNDLTTINQELATINEQLKAELTSNTAATLRLVEKNWLVNVSVPGGSVSGDVVGAVNSRL